jgi:glycerol-3-phosphate dehydrogenase
LPYQKEGPESAITRRHIIRHHKKFARGLISIIGGKLTTYRHLSEQAVNLVFKLNQKPPVPCQTADDPLPGALNIDKARRLLRQHTGLSRAGVERLLSIYGGKASQIVKVLRANELLGKRLDVSDTVLAAEVPYVIREEFATTLIDIIHRRMMVGLGADMGQEVAPEVARLAAEEFSWSAARQRRELESLEQYNNRLRPLP